MSTTTTLPLTAYLKTSYRPDREYIDGELLERNVGEWEHSDLQTAIAAWLRQRKGELGIQVVVEQRVQVKATRFRIPDITVLTGARPAGGIVTEPPFLCIEILSPEDRVREMRERVDDYLSFGVRYVWVIDPVTRWASIYSSEGVREVSDGVFSTESPKIVVRLADLNQALEARGGIEPPNKGFADLGLTTWLPRHSRLFKKIIPRCDKMIARWLPSPLLRSSRRA